jgi:hypothetical protein
MTNTLEQQLAAVIGEYENACGRSKHSDASDILSNIDVRDLQTRCLAAIERVSGRRSVYFERADAIDRISDHQWNHLAAQIGIAKSLLSDLRNEYLKTLEELIHGEMFSDFLEMAVHLVESGYKDAAAVIAGTTLEAHLRGLCTKHGVMTDTAGVPRRADGLNTDLVRMAAYSKLDQKNITAWLGLRNNAAHGNYSAYDKNQVVLLISSIRDFITRNPA